MERLNINKDYILGLKNLLFELTFFTKSYL